MIWNLEVSYGVPLKIIHLYIDAFWIKNHPAIGKKTMAIETHIWQAYPFIQVRTNFKVAFLNEFRKDARGALTAYVKAYELLLKATETGNWGNWGNQRIWWA